ncbi:MAG: DUF1501 domain-containing protein [Verrucomicrobia bacterium]|nr:DUF1501 domain-containing protein [Verrucomicrobiota bacterium]
MGLGFGALALESLLRTDSVLADESQAQLNGLPQFAPKARSVIWIFLRGGLSHLESFDPKPALDRYQGKSIPETPYSSVQDPEKLKKVRVVVVNDANGQQRNLIYPTQVGFKHYGQSGIPVSDWFPRIGQCVDDLAIIRSMWTTDDNHGAQVQFHSGRHMLDERVPTIGAWISYGLGSLNENLPKFITMGPRFFDRRDGHYLGPAYDAVPLQVNADVPLPFARPQAPMTDQEQSLSFRLANRLNRISKKYYPDDEKLEARIRSYELAYRMQMAVPETLSIEGESEATQKLYGLNQEPTHSFARQLLSARRLVERGVRFVQIMHGNGAAGEWDAHSGLKSNHASLAAQVDQPVAGLIQDLKCRGLLDETLVVFATEFGRTPGSQNADGRDHHPFGFSIWMAGGGIQGGQIHGATDELGFHAVENPHYVTDVHATLLHQLGLHERSLQVPAHKRLEIDFGSPIHQILKSS